ncbi:membrane protein [Alishewanella longhuensis]
MDGLPCRFNVAVAKLIKAPLFYMAVASQANVGGAASAPVVAAAFNPALAPVGVLLAVLGYGVGTYGAWLCGIFLQQVAP